MNYGMPVTDFRYIDLRDYIFIFKTVTLSRKFIIPGRKTILLNVAHYVVKKLLS